MSETTQVDTREQAAPPSGDDGVPIHIAKNENTAYCGLTIERWVTLEEWSNHPCKCCIKEAMGR